MSRSTLESHRRSFHREYARVHAWSDIKKLREKQMIMAQRIRVESMPEVQAKTMTVEQGNAKKAELVAAATARYQQAEALPRPTKGITAM